MNSASWSKSAPASQVLRPAARHGAAVFKAVFSPRWRKVFRDLVQNAERTLLVVAAIAVGVFAITAVSSAYAILTREIDVNYMNTNPASATLRLDAVDDDLIRAVRGRPGIGDAEARRTVRGRILIGPDEWLSIELFVINDFNAVHVSTFMPEQGDWPPATGEILIERVALSMIKAKISDMVVVKTPNGSPQELRLAGTLHDPGQAPAWMEGLAYGYITPATLAWLGESSGLNELKIVVADNILDKEHIIRTANQTQTWLEQQGRQVYDVQVPPPGKHPHGGQMSSLLFLLEALGLLSLVLSGVLVANMINAMLAGQIRQIGVMKTLGAKTGQVAGIYLGATLMLGLAALGIGLPIGLLAGRTYTTLTADILNFTITSWRLPTWVYVLQVALGLLVPTLVTAYPIYQSSRISAHQAISDYGIAGAAGVDRLGVLFKRAGGSMRPFLLSIRNTFRRRGRLALTLGTLTIAGALFMATMNIRATISNTVEQTLSSMRFDIAIGFARPYPAEYIEQAIRGVPGLTSVEVWDGGQASVLYPDGTQGNRFDIQAPPAETGLISPALIEGRWLQPGDGNALVINHKLLDDEPGMRVGKTIALQIGQQKTTWVVVGVVREVASPPGAYANYDYFVQAVAREAGFAQAARVAIVGHDMASQNAVMPSLEQALQNAALDVDTAIKLAQLRRSVEDHMLLIVNFLMLMIGMVVIVGGLGLAMTMSINVLERRREIGVMRAIGASTRAVLQIIVTEGGVIGLLSWLIAPVLAWPLGVVIGNRFGNIFLETDLAPVFSLLGLGVWLGIAVVFATLASLYPAWNASRLPVREVLAYE